MNRSELVQALVLDGEETDKGFVFAMGDMNYRIDMTTEEVGVMCGTEA